MKKEKDSKQMLFEMMEKIDPSFKRKLNEVEYDDLKTNSRTEDNKIKDVFSEFNNKSVTLYLFNEHRTTTVNGTTKVIQFSNVKRYEPEDKKYGTQGTMSNEISLNINGGGKGEYVVITPRIGQAWFESDDVLLDQDTIDMIIRFVKKAGNYMRDYDESNFEKIVRKLTERRIDPANVKNLNESTIDDNYEDVVFIQGEEAEEPLEILNQEGPDAALNYLKQWHNLGEHMGKDEPGFGSDDKTYEKDGYIMSWNPHIGYIGLVYDLSGEDESEPTDDDSWRNIEENERYKSKFDNEDLYYDEPQDDDFTPHGTYTISNTGGYEIMLNDEGDAAKVRDAFGSDNPKTSDWLEIEYVPNEEDEIVPVIDPEGYDIPLDQVMKVDR